MIPPIGPGGKPLGIGAAEAHRKRTRMRLATHARRLRRQLSTITAALASCFGAVGDQDQAATTWRGPREQQESGRGRCRC
jgi:hypothetical protein